MSKHWSSHKLTNGLHAGEMSSFLTSGINACIVPAMVDGPHTPSVRYKTAFGFAFEALWKNTIQ